MQTIGRKELEFWKEIFAIMMHNMIGIPSYEDVEVYKSIRNYYINNEYL